MVHPRRKATKTESLKRRRPGAGAPRRRNAGLLAGAACAVLAAGLLAGCGSDEPDVVLYVSADEVFAREIVAAFEADTGLTVGFVPDTEAKKTTGLVERLRAEADNPRADVFWSSEIFHTIALADEGVLEPFSSEAADAWPEQHRDGEGRWYAFAARARVIAFDPERVSEDEIPTAWTDLAQRRYAGRIAMADPRFGTTGGHLAAMKVYWDRNAMPGFYEAWLQGLRDNRTPMLTSGNAGTVEAVIRGEADFAMTDTDDVWSARRNGASIDLVYPDHLHEEQPGNGTLLIPNTVARVAGGPNPEAAATLIDYLLSEKVERMLAESTSHNIPVRESIAAEYPDYAVEDPLDVSFAQAALAMEKAVNTAVEILSQKPVEMPDVPDADRWEPGKDRPAAPDADQPADAERSAGENEAASGSEAGADDGGTG